MASSFQGQECQKEGGIAGHGDGQGESTPVSTRMTEEEDPGTGLLSSCEQALQNDLILEKICGYLPFSDLKTCRLVNRQWKRVSLPKCVQKCRPTGFFDRENIRKIPNLTQLISSSGDAFPCKSFVVDCGIVKTPEQESSVVNLFRAIAPIAETLCLDDIGVWIVGRDTPPNLQFPRLKSLKLSEPTLFLRGTLASNLNFCRDIIFHSPMFATLELNFNYAEIGNRLISILESVQGQQIRRLHLCGPLTDTHFNIITEIGLKLNCLWLWFDPESKVTEDEEGNSLTNFLSSQSSTLKVLHLRSNCSLKDKVRIGFPVMQKLTQLRCQMCWTSVRSGISRMEHFPVLQSLLIVKFHEKNLDSLFDFRIGPVETVTTLELPKDLKNPSLIWQAARIFPNVKKLVVPSYERVVMAAYEAWQKVEELTIEMGRSSADKVLTARAEEDQGLSPQPLDERGFQPVEFLHRLKVLRLKHSQRFAITDDVCRLVLLKLRSLKCLDLSEGSSDKISKEMLQEMRDKFRVIC